MYANKPSSKSGLKVKYKKKENVFFQVMPVAPFY